MKSNIYLMKTIFDISFGIGDIVYAKRNYEDNKIYFYNRYDVANNNYIGIYCGIKVSDGIKMYEIDLDNGKRILFKIININENNYELNYINVEDDITDINIVKYYKGDYQDIVYMLIENKIVITGFIGDSTNIIVPNKIDDKEVISLGNYDQYGNHIPLEMDNNKEYNIVIEDGVKYILDYCFINKKISNIIIPNSLEYIGSYAFYNCKINNIDLSNTNIDILFEGTFALSTLRKIKLPESLLEIKKECFSNSALRKITFNSNIERVEEKAFNKCQFECNDVYIDFMGINSMRNLNKKMNINCHQINHNGIKFTILGRLQGLDYDEFGNMSFKTIIFGQDDEFKYEVVIEKKEDIGIDDLYSEYEEYMHNVCINMYRVKKFEPYKHFLKNQPNLKYIKLFPNKEVSHITIKKELGKIVEIKLNNNHKYIFDDVFYEEIIENEHNCDNLDLINHVIFGIEPKNLDKINYEKYLIAKSLYKNYMLID